MLIFENGIRHEREAVINENLVYSASDSCFEVITSRQADLTPRSRLSGIDRATSGLQARCVTARLSRDDNH